jgi:hypothetical protein
MLTEYKEGYVTYLSVLFFNAVISFKIVHRFLYFFLAKVLFVLLLTRCVQKDPLAVRIFLPKTCPLQAWH